MFKVAWKNIMHRPLTLILNILLLGLGVGLMSFLFIMNDQLKEKFDNNLADIDLVVGAKGSPLQMILCNMYHIDSPTGNISIAEAKPYLKPNPALFKRVVPLSLGDSYNNFRIVGTDHELVAMYKGEVAEGKLFNKTLEVTLGHTVAQESGLKMGDTFKSSHGFTQDEDMTHDHGEMTVVGIMKPSGSVMDQLILTATSTVWAAHDHVDEPAPPPAPKAEHDHEGHDHDEHDHEGHDHDGHDHEGHDHKGHDHEGHDHEGHDHEGHDHEGHDHEGHDHEGHDHHDHGHAHVHDLSREDLMSHEDKEITAMLIQYVNKTNRFVLNLPRTISENTDMMAASPAYEINKLYSMMGAGTKALQVLGFLIALVSAISIFISLLNSLKEREYELSLLRVSGAGPGQLFSLVIFEGLILAFIGAVIGLILGRVAMFFMAEHMDVTYRYDFGTGMFGKNDIMILLAALLLGVLASLIPAMRAYRLDIHKVLSGK